MTHNRNTFDAVVLIAFGGPEKPEDVRPFLTKVSGGRIPKQRLEAVARHYDLFGGKSPVNEFTSLQAAALEATLRNHGSSLRAYVGMRNWHPLLVNTVRQLGRDGVREAVGIIMSVYQSRASWDQYQVDVANATAEAGVDLKVTYTRPFFDHPGFIKAVSNQASKCLEQIPRLHRESAHLVFTAHSLPYSDPQIELYTKQVDRSAEMAATELNCSNWQCAYQSRSGRPQDPWLEPDVNDVLRNLGERGVRDVVAVPIGFVCDNIEVLYDLDIQARNTAKEAGIAFLRARTVNDDQAFIDVLAELVTKVTEDS